MSAGEGGMRARGPLEEETGGDDVGRATRRSRLLNLSKIAFGVAVVVFGVVFVASRWNEVGDALSRASLGWVAVSFLFAILGQVLAALAFRSILAGVSRPLPVGETNRVFFVSQLGKYIPGSVWSIVALAAMTRRHGISRTKAVAGGLLALMFSVALGLVIGIVLTLVSVAGRVPELWWLLVLVPVPIVAMRPAVIEWALARLMRLMRREAGDVTLRQGALRAAVLWQAGSWLLLGLHCWALVVALSGPSWGSVVPSIGGFALAYSAGVLFLPAPAGAGIREAVLTLALGGVIQGSHDLTGDSVIVVVLLSRVLLAFVDFALAGAASLRLPGRTAGGPPTPL